ncbi:MAG: glycosyltransferase [Desulfohalobiaceae bacterium]
MNEPKSRQQKKIAIFAATSGHSGVDRVMSNLVPGLAEHGYLVDLLRISGHGPYLQENHSNIRIQELGSKHVSTSLLPLAKYLKLHKPDVLLTDKDRVNRTAVLARMLVKSKSRLVLRLGTTVSVNLQNRGFWQRSLQTASIRLLYPLADNIIVPSHGLVQDLVSVGKLDPDQIKVVPSPIITDKMLEQSREEVEHPWLKVKKLPVLLGVGELSARKDYQTLIKALALLRPMLECRLIILGEGRQRQTLEDIAKELKVDDILDLPGFVTNPYAYMAKADLFVHSSKWEGLGIVLVEALGLGTPVVSTDCPSGPREILQEDNSENLARVGDHRDLAQKIYCSLRKNKVSTTKIKKNVKKFHQNISVNKYIQSLLDQ